MPHDLFRLAYISRNTGLSDAAELDALLASARRANAQADVTGALLFNRECFAQVLEGPMPAVNSVFERIQRDPRHGDVIILLAENSPGRRFPDWAMAYAGEDPEARERFAEMRFADLRQSAVAGTELLSMLEQAVGRTLPA